MRSLLPPGSDPDLTQTYAYPADLSRPWVRVNFVSSLDGAVSVDGVSSGLGSPADKAVFGVLRRLADVILVGSGTARAERYRGARTPTIGRDTPPPIAVVTGSASLETDLGLFTDTAVPTIVLTTAEAPADRRAALREAGGDVVELPDLRVPTLLGELDRRGLRRVLCEGGPGLHGDLVAAGAVDELCLTLSPLLAAGEAGRIARSAAGVEPEDMTLHSVLEEDSTLLLRYHIRHSSEHL
ncbi:MULTISPECIES: pyrimidine reductase family protein [Pseudonocardia]|uniref:5-amino-6-(5-phosphoribosylamino)uracil reductase n=1 Tax=Pseudonocardia oroxyli TaxID=366584 RepID=A0A1G7EA99_PSEOR|nr:MULTISPECIES: pyrimidine reductase family protein [Pseudonocardia]MCF7548486.1 pyrimidine reductase family protein [Pseudonocardia sp. WMMC193]SDE60295.1 5-amino-6-(5-phosphoribosylamino)uracil reductase [Pseudonocardia oroxyli]